MRIPARMTAVYLTGHGDLDRLEVRDDVPVPRVASDQILIQVGASSVNNTDINTRIGWYTRASRERETSWDNTSWANTAIQFPRIQGADCCGRIVAVGASVDVSRIGERVLVRTMQSPEWVDGSWAPVTLGSEIDGAFAQFLVVRASEAFPIDSPLSDIELATFPCAYSTAEGLLHRAGVGHQQVLVTGASGGVGSALVQLAVLRGASVTAVASSQHHQAIGALGATRLLDRDANLLEEIGENSIDIVVDVVGGERFPELLQVLRPRGTYATSGAVGGPVVRLDLRDLYLKDLTLLGCTFHPQTVFTDLIRLIEGGRLAPLVADAYPLERIREAQERFLKKDFVGKIAVVPPPLG